jgi:hypothetical protein
MTAKRRNKKSDKIPPALAAKQKRDKQNEARKRGLVQFGGKYSHDLSAEMTHEPGAVIYMNRKARRYGLKYGLLEIDENGMIREVAQ